MIWSLLPFWAGGGTTAVAHKKPRKSLLVALTLLFAAFFSVWCYFWRKRREIWQRIVVFALREREKSREDDQLHLETRFGGRAACNVVPSVPNFRDFSCADAADPLAERTKLRTRSGQRLQSGRIFRSSNLHAASLSEADLKKLKSKTGFAKVLDLRNPNERREDGPKCRDLVGERNNLYVSITPLTLLASLVDVPTQIRLTLIGTLRPSSEDMARLAQEIIVKNCNLLGLRGLYLLTLEYNQKMVLRVMQVLTRESSAVVVQCALGKDASGLIIALLMVALDVAEEDIIYSYQMSSSLLNQEYCLRKREAINRQLDGDFFTGSSPKVIEAILLFLKDQYGSPMAYLDKIGFTSVWRARLEAKMLESKAGTSS
ncbi:unnamed protein product [Amoebophrya sp. A25]|nr:unnamed protein product [Amoebophrya sp. A25]|eukprot:GSA25T00012573001.1